TPRAHLYSAWGELIGFFRYRSPVNARRGQRGGKYRRIGMRPDQRSRDGRKTAKKAVSAGHWYFRRPLPFRSIARSTHMLHRLLPLVLLLALTSRSFTQDSLYFNPHLPVQRADIPLTMPWAGGLNAPQFSPIDLDQDGVMDLFLFDRAGDQSIFLLNTGTADQPVYTPTRAYDHVHPFPLLHGWALLHDYNCDGLADIFAYTSAAFAVYRNTSDASGLSFTSMDDQVSSHYVPTI